LPLSPMLDSAGRRRSPATLPGFHSGRTPRNKGMLYPADPPTVEEIVCVMRRASDDRHGWRLRAMIVMLWRGGLRVKEALALSERDLDPQRGSVLVRCGKGGRRAGRTCARGSPSASSFRQARCSARSTGPPAGDRGRLPRSAPSFAATPSRQASGDASHLISCVMRTRSSSPARECRSTSSSASSVTPTSAPRASTFRESTSRRSSRLCTRAAPP
jgi:hypothetical protein